MNTLVRFWVMVASVVVGLSSFGYLFLGFLFPSQLSAAPESRLAITLLGAVAAGLFIWATFITNTQETLNQNQ